MGPAELDSVGADGPSESVELCEFVQASMQQVLVGLHNSPRSIGRHQTSFADLRELRIASEPSAANHDVPGSLVEPLDAWSSRVEADRGPEVLLFPHADDGVANRRWFQRVWARAARDAGWPMKRPTAAA